LTQHSDIYLAYNHDFIETKKKRDFENAGVNIAYTIQSPVHVSNHGMFNHC